MKKIILTILALAFLASSCSKPKGNGYCANPERTTGMSVFLNSNKKDSCQYDSLEINLNFSIEFAEDGPPCGTFYDSIIDHITRLDVISCSVKENDTIRNTVNDVVKYSIVYPTYKGTNVVEDTLSNLPGKNLNGGRNINLFFISFPDTSGWYFFEITYEEDDGTKYEGTTKTVYVIK